MILQIILRYRLFLIRATFPLIFLALLWTGQHSRMLIFGFLLISFLDVAEGIIQQFFWRITSWDLRFAAWRDTFYALAFYILFIQNPQISALVLAPTVLAELYILFGQRAFIRAVYIEIALLIVRMVTIYRIHHLLHPTWAILICVASVIMALLAIEITQLEKLHEQITRQQAQLKETLTEMLTVTLSPNGIDKEVLLQENIGPLLEDICVMANCTKGMEIGRRLAQVIATRQSAANLITHREREVLELISENISYRKISEQLQVSEGTVRAHAASIMRKADVHSRNELIVWAHAQHLLPETSSSP